MGVVRDRSYASTEAIERGDTPVSARRGKALIHVRCVGGALADESGHGERRMCYIEMLRSQRRRSSSATWSNRWVASIGSIPIWRQFSAMLECHSRMFRS